MHLNSWNCTTNAIFEGNFDALGNTGGSKRMTQDSGVSSKPSSNPETAVAKSPAQQRRRSAVLPWVAFAISLGSLIVAGRAYHVAQMQAAVAVRNEMRAVADYPSVLLRELAWEGTKPWRQGVQVMPFNVMVNAPGDVSDVEVEIGTTNLNRAGKRGIGGSFFEGYRVSVHRFARVDYAEPARLEIVASPASFAYALVDVVYRVTWKYGAPAQTGVSVGEFLYVYEDAWSDVCRVQSDDIDAEGRGPRLSTLVVARSLGEPHGSERCWWYDHGQPGLKQSEVPRASLVQQGYVEDIGPCASRKGKVDAGRYPNVMIHRLPGEEAEVVARLRDGLHVIVRKRVGNWLLISPSSNTARTAWIASRCVKWTEPCAKLPVSTPFEGWTLLVKSTWASTELMQQTAAIEHGTW